MKINYVTQINILPNEFDYFICSSGYEKRSSFFFSNNMKNLTSAKKVCFQFSDRKVLSREQNDRFFKDNDFDFYTVKEDNIESYFLLIKKILPISSSSKSLKIAVDFSTMTTLMYAALLKYFMLEDFLEVSLYFSYTRALHYEDTEKKSLSINTPISIYDNVQTTDRKITLIIGLGTEKDKALGLSEYFQTSFDDIYIFSTDLSKDNLYSSAMNESNQELLKKIDSEHILYYDIENVSHLLSTMYALVNYLISVDHRIVIAPTGPKQFTLISLIINLFHEEITTYRLSSGSKARAIDKSADLSKRPIVTLINLTRN